MLLSLLRTRLTSFPSSLSYFQKHIRCRLSAWTFCTMTSKGNEDNNNQSKPKRASDIHMEVHADYCDVRGSLYSSGSKIYHFPIGGGEKKLIAQFGDLNAQISTSVEHLKPPHCVGLRWFPHTSTLRVAIAWSSKDVAVYTAPQASGETEVWGCEHLPYKFGKPATSVDWAVDGSAILAGDRYGDCLSLPWPTPEVAVVTGDEDEETVGDGQRLPPRLLGHISTLYTVRVTRPQGRCILTGDNEGRLRCSLLPEMPWQYPIRGIETVSHFMGHQSAVMVADTLRIPESPFLLVSGDLHGTLKLWSGRGGVGDGLQVWSDSVGVDGAALVTLAVGESGVVAMVDAGDNVHVLRCVKAEGEGETFRMERVNTSAVPSSQSAVLMKDNVLRTFTKEGDDIACADWVMSEGKFEALK